MKNKRGNFLIGLGILCVLLAVGITIYNMLDDARAAVDAVMEWKKLQEVLPNQPEGGNFSGDMPVKEVDGVKYVAMISIPAIEIELPVRAEWSYQGLRYSPCRYCGSAYENDLVICAHNYTYHFGKLKDLHQGDTVYIVDMNGNVFQYQVEKVETLMPTAISKMVDSEYDLSLFTCTLGGRTRVTVRCNLAE